MKIVEIDKKIESTLKEKALLNEYKNDYLFLDNSIIYYEYLKDFVSIMIQKHQFENIVDELYTQYSSKLEDFYNLNKY